MRERGGGWRGGASLPRDRTRGSVYKEGGGGISPTPTRVQHTRVRSPEPLCPRDGRSPAQPLWGEALWD